MQWMEWRGAPVALQTPAVLPCDGYGWTTHVVANPCAPASNSLNGTIQELMIGNEAGMAIAFAAREQIFDVRALPGNLSEDEQTALGDLLEETGLFTRVSEFRPPGPAGHCGPQKFHSRM